MPTRPEEHAMIVLVTAASKHGATGEIAAAIGRTLEQRGLTVDVMAPEEVSSVGGYDAVVLGSAIYAGHWLAAATELVERCSAELAGRPVWLFSSGAVGDPSRKLVQKMRADPVDLPEIQHATHAREHRLFAGRLEKKGLSRSERAVLAMMRSLEGDFRDWAEIEAWSQQIAAALLQARLGPRGGNRARAAGLRLVR